MIVCFKRFFRIFMINIRFLKYHNVLFLQYKTGNFSGLVWTTLHIYTTGAEELTRSRADPNFAGPLFLWPNFEPITTFYSVRTTPLGDKLKIRPIRPHLYSAYYSSTAYLSRKIIFNMLYIPIFELIYHILKRKRCKNN